MENLKKGNNILSYRTAPKKSADYPKVITAEEKDKVLKYLIENQENGKMEVIARYSDISNLVCSKEQFKSIIDELVQDYGLSHFGYGDKYKLNNTILDFYSNGGFNAKVNVKQNDILNREKMKVFIVHGHDVAAKESVARFIEKIGCEAIILSEQANGGNTIIEKIEKNTDVGYAIVIYTPCDKGGKNKENAQLEPRARQNVVFEHGYLIAKLGRKNVSVLMRESVVPPSDISGLGYEPLDDNGAWRNNVAKNMKDAGYSIDMNNIQ